MLFTRLLDFQRKIRSAFRRETTPAQLIEEVKPLPSMQQPTEQLQVYRQSVTSSLKDVLSKIYPVTVQFVGKPFFSWMSRQFIEKYHGEEPDLHNFGDKIPQFLEELDVIQKLPFLPDFAKLEWAIHFAMQADEDPPFDFSALSHLCVTDQDKIIFHLPQNATLLKSSYPLYRLWEIQQRHFLGDKSISWKATPPAILIHKRDGQLQLEQLDSHTTKVIELFQKNLPFSDICESLEKFDGSPAAAALLPHYLQRRWLSRFTIET